MNMNNEQVQILKEAVVSYFKEVSACLWRVKVKLFLCLTKHYAMKTYWGELRYSFTHT
jgi:hypothetical protein